LTFQAADAAALPFDNESFDVIISFGVLHHIEGWQKALSEIKRVLKTRRLFSLRRSYLSGSNF
jgi:ubiquinone/menaquinone biosynthesis C-methylase UbiE